jgi:glutathione S-transferase
MRPWVMLRQAGITFTEQKVLFDSFGADSKFKQVINAITPVGKVPVLVDGELKVWDTLAIAEYAAELYPEKQLWPADRAARAHARSICAEMHSGFGQLRSHCPMNIEANLQTQGQLIWRDQAGVRADVGRIVSMWTQLLEQHGGPLLFGHFTIADAYFAPVCMRLKTYGLPVPVPIAGYINAVFELPSVKAWVAEAKIEDAFKAFEEPYRLAR